jgi:hypothetical protein
MLPAAKVCAICSQRARRSINIEQTHSGLAESACIFASSILHHSTHSAPVAAIPHRQNAKYDVNVCNRLVRWEVISQEMLLVRKCGKRKVNIYTFAVNLW